MPFPVLCFYFSKKRSLRKLEAPDPKLHTVVVCVAVDHQQGTSPRATFHESRLCRWGGVLLHDHLHPVALARDARLIVRIVYQATALEGEYDRLSSEVSLETKTKPNRLSNAGRIPHQQYLLGTDSYFRRFGSRILDHQKQLCYYFDRMCRLEHKVSLLFAYFRLCEKKIKSHSV